MNIIEALRADRETRIAFVGAGGKTSAFFSLARDYNGPVLLTASTHLLKDQVGFADKYNIATNIQQLKNQLSRPFIGTFLITGKHRQDQRTQGLDKDLLDYLGEFSRRNMIPLLIEADGARQKSIKAPAEYEPVIPKWVDKVAVVIGMSSLGKVINEKYVHRPQIFADVTGASQGDLIDLDLIYRYLVHPAGGLKNIPKNAERIAILNQVSSELLENASRDLAERLLISYSRVLIANITQWELAGQNDQTADPVLEIRCKTAGIVLAGGGASRFGEAKLLLDWYGEPIIRAITKKALNAGLSPVIVVVGSFAEKIVPVIQDLPVKIVLNLHWEKGQSGSLKRGIEALPADTGAVVMMLADQPHIPFDIIPRLISTHQKIFSPIVLPYVNRKRANPVLFDRVTFPDLLQISGDKGGRAIFSDYQVEKVEVAYEQLLHDIDTIQDYEFVLNMGWR